MLEKDRQINVVEYILFKKGIEYMVNKKIKFCIILLIIFMSMSYPTPTYALTETKLMSNDIDNSEIPRNNMFDVSEGDINISVSGNYIITGKKNGCKINIEDNLIVNLTLQDLELKSEREDNQFTIGKNSKVYITLIGNNIIQGHQDKEHRPAISMQSDSELHFINDSTGSIVIHGGSNYWGGSPAIQGGNLYIEGGNITLVGGNKIVNSYGKSFELESLVVTGGSLNCYQGIINSTSMGEYSAKSINIKKPENPQFTINTTSTSLEIHPTNYVEEYGKVEYRINEKRWQTSNKFIQLTPDTSYEVSVRYKGKVNISDGSTSKLTIKTLKNGNLIISEPTNLTAIFGMKLRDIILPSDWEWSNSNIDVSTGQKTYIAYFDTTSYEKEYDFTNVLGYNADDHHVEREISVNVSKADSKISINTSSLDKQYDGKIVSDPEVEKTGSTKEVILTWYEKDGNSWKKITLTPKNVGTYKVIASVEADNNYNSASDELTFVISQTENSWVDELSIKDWIYGDKASVPSAKAQYGEVSFTYSSEKNGTYTREVPKNAGTWYVKATVEGTENYTGLESVVSFTIAKAETTLTFEKNNIDKTYDNNVISEPKVSKIGSSNDLTFAWFVANGNDWKQLDNAPSDVGTYKVVVSVTEDTNYNGASIEKEFSISMVDNEWTKELSIKDWIYGETSNAPSATAKYGDVVYTYSNSKDGTYTSDVPVNAGKWYVKASVAGTANYTGLESVPVSFEIKKADSSIQFKDGIAFDKVFDTNTVIVTEEQIEKTGSTGTVSFTFEKKVNDEWKTVETPTEVGTYRVTATLAEDNNHTSATSKPLEFTITKANSTVTITTQSLNKVYDGNAVSAPEYTTSGSDGKVTIKWQEKSMTAKTEWKDLKSAPSTVGTYRVVVELAGNDNYNPASATLDFVISQATNTWVEELSITGWTYNEKANVPTAKAQYGEVSFTYSSEENGTYTREVPKNAGTWYVKATVEGTENYAGLTSAPVAFEIAKAIPTYENITNLVLEQGQELSKIELPEQFKWVDDTLTADELGTHTFKAIYTPEDTANYQTIEVEIEVKVVPTPVAINHVPTITASDKTITVGDTFEALKDVTATDKEDGDLTSKIKVINNTVDTTKAGIYEVRYQVTDSQGATVTETVKVTVKAVSVNTDKDKLDNDKNNGSVETGDRTNLLLWEVMLIGSSIVLLCSLYRKKRKTQ